MGANIKYAGSRRMRGMRLAFGAVCICLLVKFMGLVKWFGYDADAYGWMMDTSVLPSIRHETPGGKSHGQHQHTTEWTGYSLKPLAYVFPQFHAIPENDEFWGTGFTEWNNVQRVEVNRHGLPTLRPANEIGYYNLLDYDVRKRYSKLIRDSGLYGVAYHHYWFGYPVMDRVLQAMLDDGQPDVPFMLSWANEAWTKRWDGASGGTLLDQNYGNTTEWRKHFDWMAKYFRHPKYIRSNGKVQIVVYAPSKMGDQGKRMFAQWRRWAAQDPKIGGLDVMETGWSWDYPPGRGHTDAIAEFAPHSGGGLDHTLWERNPRRSTVHHRSVMVGWDNTPRHPTDGAETVAAWNHPKLWELSLISLLRRVKLEPNPRGEENFLFINALNEWGEGNTLEPSAQWGYGFSEALRSAIDYAEKNLPWIDECMRQGEEFEEAVADLNSQVDVCVIVRDATGHYPWSQPWQLSHTLWSLQAQHNTRWRALVLPAGEAFDIRGIASHVMDTYDPRVLVTDIPPDVRSTEGVNTTEGITDWVIERLDELAPSCAQATYMLVTDSSIQYEPHAFDAAAQQTTDIIGLNFVSNESMTLQNQRAGSLGWMERCERYTNAEPANLCEPMVPSNDDLLDLPSALINLRRWREEDHKFLEAATAFGGPGNAAAVQILAALQARADLAWEWATPPSGQCDVIHPGTYQACTQRGHIWYDGPDVEGFRSGCHSGLGLQYDFGDENLTTHWDYRRFKEADPLCVRLSETRYEDVLAGRVQPHVPGTKGQPAPGSDPQADPEKEAAAAAVGAEEGQEEVGGGEGGETAAVGETRAEGEGEGDEPAAPAS